MNILSYIKNKLKESYASNNSNASGGSANELGGSTNTSGTGNAEEKLKDLEGFIDSRYGSYSGKGTTTTPEPPTYERYEYEAPTDEKIKESAEAELNDYLQNNESSIKNEYDNKAKQLEANKTANEKLYADSSEKLKATYNEVAEALSNDALKRGLARSSIAIGSQAAANKAYAENINNLVAQHNEKIAAIDDEIAGLDGQLQNALDSFKISYAAKLTQRINELKEEREKNKQAALKYNNSLLKDEYEQKLNKEKTDSSLYSDAVNRAAREQALKGSLNDEQKENIEREIYDKMVEVLDSMTPAEAREAVLNNPLFRDNLSDYYFYSLYYRYKQSAK